MPPHDLPIGLSLTRTSRLVSRAFDDALTAAGGSLPVWLVLLNLKTHRGANQRQIAELVGVTGPTLTHHLNAMERDGLLARHRDPDNRRNHIIELTAAGEAAFAQLAPAVLEFDRRLRADFSAGELDLLRALLERLGENVAPEPDGPPWAGLIEDSSAPVGGTLPSRARSRE